MRNSTPSQAVKKYRRSRVIALTEKAVHYRSCENPYLPKVKAICECNNRVCFVP